MLPLLPCDHTIEDERTRVRKGKVGRTEIAGGDGAAHDIEAGRKKLTELRRFERIRFVISSTASIHVAIVLCRWSKEVIAQVLTTLF